MFRNCDEMEWLIMLKAKIIFAVIYFLILYSFAWISARGYREDDAILGVNRSQWLALFVMWIPVLVAFME